MDLEDTALEKEIMDTMVNGSKRLRNLMTNMSLDNNGIRYFKSQDKDKLQLLKEQCTEIEKRK